MDAHRANVAEGAHQEDVTELADGVEPGSQSNVVPPEDEQPLLLSVVPIADAVGKP